MLALFRNNQVATALVLAVYVTVLHLPALLGWIPLPANRPAEGGVLYMDLCGWVSANTGYSTLAALVLVYLQALLFNGLADTYRLMDDRNWVPGAMYALAASCIPDFLVLTPALVAMTFVPLTLRRVFGVYKLAQAHSTIFDGAFWIVVAILFHPPAAWLLLVSYFGVLSLRVFHVREQMVFLAGAFVPTFLAFAAYLWADRAGLFVGTQFTEWIALPAFQIPAALQDKVKMALLLAILLAVVLGFNVYYHKRLIQVQKYVTIFYWLLFAGAIAALLSPDLRAAHFLLLMPSVGIFLAYLFQSIRNTFMAEAFHLLLLLAIFFVQFFPLILLE